MSTPVPDLTLNATAASILGFLRDGPATGWDLDQRIKGSIGNFWNVTRSQIYRELRALAGAGYVEVGKAGKRDSTPYTITDAGRAAFGEWINQDPAPELIRSPLLITLFFGDALDEARLIEITAAARERHVARLAEYQALEPLVTQFAPFPAHTLRFGIKYETAMLEWLDSLPWAPAPARDPRGRGGKPPQTH